MVRQNYSVDIFGGERDKVGKTCRDMGREDGGRGKRGANVFHPLGKVGNTVINREGRRKGRGGRGEEGK